MARDSGWLSSQVLRQQWYSIFIPGSTPSSTPSSVAPVITYRYYVALRNVDNHPSMARKMGVFGPSPAASDCSFDGLVSITRFLSPAAAKKKPTRKPTLDGYHPPPPHVAFIKLTSGSNQNFSSRAFYF